MPKDLFSQQATLYAKYRPTYPKELFDYIISFVEERKCAWDCATGNGQAAVMLADYFERVEATDISEAQLTNAIQKQNIYYSISAAEHTKFDDNSFDLITVAQAYHWLNWKEFYKEAIRVAKRNAVVAAWAYNLFYCHNEKLNELFSRFYSDIVGEYWDYERKYVDEEYKTVDFRFAALPSKKFSISVNWNKEQVKGYLLSWSAVQKFIRENNSSPISLIEEDFHHIWGNEKYIQFHFPLFLKIGRVVK